MCLWPQVERVRVGGSHAETFLARYVRIYALLLVYNTFKKKSRRAQLRDHRNTTCYHSHITDYWATGITGNHDNTRLKTHLCLKLQVEWLGVGRFNRSLISACEDFFLARYVCIYALFFSHSTFFKDLRDANPRITYYLLHYLVLPTPSESSSNSSRKCVGSFLVSTASMPCQSTNLDIDGTAWEFTTKTSFASPKSYKEGFTKVWPRFEWQRFFIP